MKKILIPIGILVVGTVKSQLTPLPATENYIQTKTYLDYNGTQVTKSAETVQYFDGLGRPKQVVNVKASPLGRDIVTPIVYDNFGRQTRDYLPVPQSGTQNGSIYPQTSGMVNFPVSDATGIYTGEKIYSEKVLENSPLDRIQQQIQVGNDWNTQPVKFEYSAVSVNDQVRKFTTVSTWENGATKSVLGENWLYTDNQLYKNTVTDEDGNKTIEFKNGNGQLIMVRKEDGSSTYYVYNEYDQLAFVIPPIASMRGDIVPNTTKQDELCYQYRYDGRGRLVEKKLPGKGWESMIYDKQDRLVATQDAELKIKGQWLYTKYDSFGRVAITGIGTGGERFQEQDIANSYGPNSVNRINTAFFERQGMNVYYDNPDTTYPNSTKWVTLLSLNYYDSYPAYGFNPVPPANTPEMTVLTSTPTSDGRSTKGLPLMSFVKNIEDDNWTKNYTYYDQKARVIGTHSINHLGGYTRTESKLDFAGLPLQALTRHKRLASDTERVITENFEYDSQNRLLVHKHQVDNNPVEYLTQNKYNELSQLESKKV
ncbi:MAG TPA: sugar-binding protein, partial [Chryseobacterium sp.]|nr:sugar-binding protein [Chryseobacterium sp.]